MSMRERFSISGWLKRVLPAVVDFAIIPISLYAAIALRYGNAAPVLSDRIYLFLLITLVGAGVVLLCRLPQIELNAFASRAMAQIGLAALSLAGVAMACSYLLGVSGPRSVSLIFGSLFFLFSVSVRIISLILLVSVQDRQSKRPAVLIYGAGAAGIQLVSALRHAREARPVALIDDNPGVHGLMIAGLPVCAPTAIKALIAKHDVTRILVAIPSSSNARQAELLKQLSEFPIEVQVLPSYGDWMAGRGLQADLSTITPEELLGQDRVDLTVSEVQQTYGGRVVMVTGAGGAIGSELCRQLIDCNPAGLVLFDYGEAQLDQVREDLRILAREAGVQLTARLGSVTNAARVRDVIATEKVDIIVHVAAHKHVPLLEENPVEAALNNVMGTRIVAQAAMAAQVDRFLLISTDRAAHPTNIMGATKRLAELVIQDLAARSSTTRFATVRFGNVLGATGSLLSLFQKQIEAGGPVTVPHPEVTRFFMTASEATRLLVLAGAYTRGKDLFVLDMGEPQKIIDIARRMIELAGRSPRTVSNGEGSIAIEMADLRPGEKLYEDGRTDDAPCSPTPHAKIFRSQDAGLAEIELAALLRDLQTALADENAEQVHAVLARVMERGSAAPAPDSPKLYPVPPSA